MRSKAEGPGLLLPPVKMRVRLQGEVYGPGQRRVRARPFGPQGHAQSQGTYTADKR